MAFKPVGICTAITLSTSSAQSSTFSQQSAYVRVVALTKGAHVTIGGTNPIATPANWPNNHADIEVDGERTTEFKGSVFLLPTVSPEDAEANYPGYHTCDVPSKISYLRLVKADDV